MRQTSLGGPFRYKQGFRTGKDECGLQCPVKTNKLGSIALAALNECLAVIQT